MKKASKQSSWRASPLGQFFPRKVFECLKIEVLSVISRCLKDFKKALKLNEIYKLSNAQGLEAQFSWNSVDPSEDWLQ